MTSNSARAVIDRAVARHGGWDRWERLETIELEVCSLGGLVPWIKGLGRTFPMMGRCTIAPRARRMVAHDFPEPGAITVFDRGRVTTTDASATPRFDHENYRERFEGLAKLRRWSAADATYFFGYALTHYLSLPFSLAEANVIEHRERPGHAVPDRLTVRYGPEDHTHGAVERFHFDPSGLLVRHDYHAEILGPGTHGAHATQDYASFDGLMIARHRRVTLRVGGWATSLPVLEARLRPLSADP